MKMRELKEFVIWSVWVLLLQTGMEKFHPFSYPKIIQVVYSRFEVYAKLIFAVRAKDSIGLVEELMVYWF